MKKQIFMAILAILSTTATTMAQEHKHSANEHMNRSSTDDLVKRFESPERDASQQPEKVLEYLGDLRGKTIMDIGAGSGYFSVKLAAKGARVIAADVSDEFQAHLKKRLKKTTSKTSNCARFPTTVPRSKTPKPTWC
jgi:2-polyprenyl-3-methyl-5-hydroxy-6-metoxy-1,4-benzoquinol methylase